MATLRVRRFSLPLFRLRAVRTILYHEVFVLVGSRGRRTNRMDGARARESNRVAFVLPLSGRSVVIQLSEYYKYHEQWRHGARFELVFCALHAPSGRVAVEKDDGENQFPGCW